MILDRRTFQCSAYHVEIAGPGGALIFHPPVSTLGVVYIPNLAAGIGALVDALRTARKGGVGTFGGDITFTKMDNAQLRILSENYSVFLAGHLAEQLLQDLETMQ